jgi:hypothetical protein
VGGGGCLLTRQCAGWGRAQHAGALQGPGAAWLPGGLGDTGGRGGDAWPPLAGVGKTQLVKGKLANLGEEQMSLGISFNYFTDVLSFQKVRVRRSVSPLPPQPPPPSRC